MSLPQPGATWQDLCAWVAAKTTTGALWTPADFTAYHAAAQAWEARCQSYEIGLYGADIYRYYYVQRFAPLLARLGVAPGEEARVLQSLEADLAARRVLDDPA